MKHIIKVESFDNLSIVRPLVAMRETSGEFKFSIKEPRTIITGTWDPSLTDNAKEVLIRGSVQLYGKTDCYSILFEDENSHLTINGGARLRVWQGGIVNNDCNTVNYLTINEDYVSETFGEFLLHPDVIVNTQPKAYVRLITTCKQAGSNTYVWDRFTIPTIDGSNTIYDNEELDKIEIYGGGSFAEGLAEWNGNDWVGVSRWKNLQPFKGYQLTNNSMYGNVIYTFTGNINGNSNKTISTLANHDICGNTFLSNVCISVLQSVLNINNCSLSNLYIGSKEKSLIGLTKIPPMTCFTVSTPSTSIQLTLLYKDLVWDPSFEEEATLTHSLLMGGLTSSKPEETDTTLEGSTIFSDPEPIFLIDSDER